MDDLTCVLIFSFIFCKIMNSIETYYRITDLIPSASGYFPTPLEVSELPLPFWVQRVNVYCLQSPTDDINKSKLEVVGQLNYIRDKILAKVDIHLHNHLLKLDIPLPIFGM